MCTDGARVCVHVHVCPWRRRRPSASPGVICRQDWIPAGSNTFLPAAMHSCRQYVGHPHLSTAIPVAHLSTGMYSCRQKWTGIHSCRQEFSPAGAMNGQACVQRARKRVWMRFHSAACALREYFWPTQIQAFALSARGRASLLLLRPLPQVGEMPVRAISARQLQ